MSSEIIEVPQIVQILHHYTGRHPARVLFFHLPYTCKYSGTPVMAYTERVVITGSCNQGLPVLRTKLFMFLPILKFIFLMQFIVHVVKL